MKITVFDHQNQQLLEEISGYNLDIDVKIADVRDLIQNNKGTQDYHVAFVSPANSFGFMNGGIDAVYSEIWPDIEELVRMEVQLENFAELLVGRAVIAWPWDFTGLVAAPTMRTPSKILDASDIYLATRAAVYETRCRSRIKHLFIPGMGTGVGMIHPSLAARNMAMGIKHGLDGAPYFETCAQSAVQHEVLRKL